MEERASKSAYTRATSRPSVAHQEAELLPQGKTINSFCCKQKKATIMSNFRDLE